MKKSWMILAALGGVLILFLFSFRQKNAPVQNKTGERVSVHSAAIVRKPAAAPVSTNLPQSNLSAEEIALWIASDAYCEENNKHFRSAENPAADPQRRIRLYEGLVLAQGSAGSNPCVQSMLAITKEDVLYLSSRSQDSTCQLIRALVLTGQWELARDAGKPKAAEISEGKRILQSLAAEDPTNGFYVFFELGAQKSGDREVRAEIYRRFLQAEDYRNPFQHLLGDLKKLGHTNPTAFLYSVELYSSLSIPNFSPAAREAKKLAREGLFADDFQAWVSRFSRHLEMIDLAGLGEPFSNLVDDAILRSIALSGKEHLRSVPSILKKEAWISHFQRRALSQDLSTLVGDEPTCEETLSQARERFRHWVEEDERQLNAIAGA